MSSPEQKTIPRYIRLPAGSFEDRHTGDIHIFDGVNPPVDWISLSDYLKIKYPDPEAEKKK
jgi:hypothetical protein